LKNYSLLFSPSFPPAEERVDERSDVGVSKLTAMQFAEVVLKVSHGRPAATDLLFTKSSDLSCCPAAEKFYITN
jgi:hypothetical protein